MLYNEFQNIVRYGTPFDSGNMMEKGWAYFNTPHQYIAIANVAGVPYIVYNEEGTIYTKKNQYFIRKGIVGMLNHATYSEQLGMPYSYEEVNKTLKNRRNSIMQSMGVLGVTR